MPTTFATTDELLVTLMLLVTLITTALGLQFAAFGWRIIREIQLGDEGRRTWFLVTDYFIILSMAQSSHFASSHHWQDTATSKSWRARWRSLMSQSPGIP